MCYLFQKQFVWKLLKGAFIIQPDGPPPPKSKVHGMTFHNMQRKYYNWVNPFLTLGSQFWEKKHVNKQIMLESTMIEYILEFFND
jgi:hypothetical protein